MDAFLCEYSTIGALLIDPEAYPEAAELRPDDFLHPAFAAVFRAIQRRNDAGEPADAATVRDEAARECEGVTNDLLIQCMEVVSSSAVLPEYVQGVKDASLGRRLRDLGEELRDADIAPQEALQRVSETVGELTTLASSTKRVVSLAEAITGLKTHVDEGYTAKERPFCRTWLKNYDKMLGGGYINGGMHIIAARPAVGKSAVAMQIALSAAQNGVKVLYISLEMDPEDCAARITANAAGMSSRKLIFGAALPEDEYAKFAQGAAECADLPLLFNKRPNMDMGDVTALAYKERPGLIILDHLGLMEPENKRMTLYEATTRNSRALKMLAMRLKIPVVVLCQLNRAAASDRGGSFRATMANLRESGAIEQDADTVTLLHRPPTESDGNPWDPVMLQLYLDKNRRGPTGMVEATFFPATGRVVD